MRANSSLSSLVVVMLAVVGGCTPAEDPPVGLAPPEPTAPDPAPAPTQATVDDLLREAQPTSPTNVASPSVALPPPVRRLFFQCSDDVTFAVRSAGSRLEVFPPGQSYGYIVLAQQPSDPGLYSNAGGAELRMHDDLATLQIGRDRYVDCVSNPAAAVWQEPPRTR